MILSAIDVGDRAVSKNGEMILTGRSQEDRHCAPASCAVQRKMYRIVTLVLCYQALSQPVTDETLKRRVRQLAECCPCPGNDDGGQDIIASGQIAVAGGLDDCPCRPRGVDSDGASSMFFPSAVRSDEPHMRPIDHPVEDPKNLLEPEVALATSMLDTLREATEEEYQEALAREAARSAAEADAVPEESARNVVIIVNPPDSDNNDDFISEASHGQESRCIHPLESTSLGQIRSSTKPINAFLETLKVPKLKRPILHMNSLNGDSHLKASNVEESIVGKHDNFQEFQSYTPKLPIKNVFENSFDTFNFEKSNSNFGKLQETKSSFLDSLNLPFTPKLNLETSLNTDDLATAPSSTQHQLKKADDKTSQLLRRPKLPLDLRNLLKLRDVELIPKTIHNRPLKKTKLDLSKFAIPMILKRNQKENKNENISNEEVNRAIILENNDDSDSRLKNLDSCEISENKQNNFETLPNLSQLETSTITGSEVENIENFESSADNVPDYSSLETKELSNSNTHIREIHNELKELGHSKSSTDFIDENNDSTKDSQNQEIELFSQNQDFDLDHDSETDSSDKISTLMPLQTQERILDLITQSQENIDPSWVQDVDISRSEYEMKSNAENPISNKIKKMVSNTNEIPDLKETTSNFRENLENLQEPCLITESSIMFNNKDKIIDNDSNLDYNDDLNKKPIEHNDINTDMFSTAKETGTDISIQDLQEMSDKLLDSNSNNEKNGKLIKVVECEKEAESDDLKLDELNSDSDIETSETIQDAPITVKDLSFDTKPESKEENTCATTFENRKVHKSEENAFKSASQDAVSKEMETGASEAIVKTLPGIWDTLNSKLKLRTPLDDIVSKPAADPLNLLSKPLNVLNLNTNLPTLEDIKERLANIFNTKDRSVENCSGSFDIDSSNDTPFETMSPEASTRNSQKELPTLRQLENFNSDLFQTKPSTSLLNSPKLNLNAYRTNVPIPNNLNLKPIKIESALGKKVGVDRSLLNFGSDRSSARNAKPRKLLANPLENIPTLEDLKHNLRLNNRNLLNRPLDPNLNLFNENLRSNDIEDFAENFRINTQKTMKGIQQKMKSTLKKTKIRGPLDDAFANPLEFFDDINDKLKAIHYDLNDRLSSLHETLVDQPGKAANRNVMTNLRRNKVKPRPTRLQTAASTISTQEVDPNEHNNEQKNIILGSESKNTFNKNWIKSQKTETSEESALIPVYTPKPVNKPLSYLQSTPPMRKNPIMTQLLRERKPLTNLYETNRALTNFEDERSPLLGTAASAFDYKRQPNKVTISFGTTTAKPISPPRPVVRVPSISSLRYKEHNPSISSKLNEKSKESMFVPNHKLESGRDSLVKFKPLRTTAPIQSSDDEEFEDNMDNSSEEQNFLTNYNSRPSILRETPNSDIFRMQGNAKRLKSSEILDDGEAIEISPSKSLVDSSFDWPKVAGNSFLSKVRDAVNTRKLNNNNHKHVKKLETEQSEMLRSPSEHTDNVLDEPLKENVSYRCRLVCTKEIR